MSTIQLASVSSFRYQRLKHESVCCDDDERDRWVVNPNPKPKRWYRLRRIPIRRRFRLKVPSLTRLWRRKARLVSALRVSYAKVLKRFKDGHGHFGDLFAGNYLFLQVNPASFKYLRNELSLSKIA